ncbi:2449_t:CDS:1, partial [Acaulospora morrowiae]
DSLLPTILLAHVTGRAHHNATSLPTNDRAIRRFPPSYAQ